MPGILDSIQAFTSSPQGQQLLMGMGPYLLAAGMAPPNQRGLMIARGAQAMQQMQENTLRRKYMEAQLKQAQAKQAQQERLSQMASGAPAWLGDIAAKTGVPAPLLQGMISGGNLGDIATLAGKKPPTTWETVNNPYGHGGVYQRSNTGEMKPVYTPPAQPSAINEYLFARQQGYKGSFADWKKQAGNVGQETFGNTPVWGTDENGNTVLLQTSNRGNVKRLDLPGGVKPQRGQTSRVDLGDKWAILDANGALIGYQVKGLAPERKIDQQTGTETVAPAIPGTAPTLAPGAPTTRTELPQTPTEMQAAATKEAAHTEDVTSQADVGLNAIEGIKREMKTATLPTTGTVSQGYGWLSSTNAGRVRAYVASLRSGIVRQTMMRLKDASKSGATGFGQLNRSELQVLIDAMGALDPDNTPEDIFRQTLDRIEGQYKRVMSDIKRNVSPERLKELGLDELVNKYTAPKIIQYDANGNRVQ